MSASSRGRRFAVRGSPIHGRGVFALRPIRKGERIVEYLGRRVPPARTQKLLADDPGRPSHTFLFELDDGTIIDAARGGNSARFINHACQPNCEAAGIRIRGQERIVIQALRAIRPGEELSYDYRLALEHRPTAADRARYACRCGSRRCRGTMLA